MKVVPSVIFYTLLASACFAQGHAQRMRCPQDKSSEEVAPRFTVSIGTVSIPVGAFLLVRKNNQLGAIRITGIDPAATEWLGKSTYESYFQPDASGSLLAANVVHITDHLDIQELKGPGRARHV